MVDRDGMRKQEPIPDSKASMNTMTAPLVSVVIPTYNHAHFLGRALQSVLDQTYPHWEAIIIDNHSRDNTDLVVAELSDPRIRLLKIHNHGVIAASRNLGIRVATGEWIAFLDSDDWWTRNKLQVCVDSINDEVDLLHHDLKIIREKPALCRPGIIKSRQIKQAALLDLLVGGNQISNSSVLVRKKIFDDIGLMNESHHMIGCEDYNTWLRIAQVSNRFYFIPQSLGYYFLHRGGVSQKDMSLPARCAMAEFMSILNDDQKYRIELKLKYTQGRSEFLNRKYADAKLSLKHSVKSNVLSIRIKSLWMLSLLFFS